MCVVQGFPLLLTDRRINFYSIEANREFLLSQPCESEGKQMNTLSNGMNGGHAMPQALPMGGMTSFFTTPSINHSCALVYHFLLHPGYT